MKRILIPILGILAIFQSCKTVYVPLETKYETITNYKDSLRIKDSIRVIPIERYIDIVRPCDTLHLSTSLAEATAYYDSTFHALRGEIHNKRDFEQHFKETEHATAKADTVRIREQIPVEVKVPEPYVPKAYKILSLIGIISILSVLVLLGIKIYRLKDKGFLNLIKNIFKK